MFWCDDILTMMMTWNSLEFMFAKRTSWFPVKILMLSCFCLESHLWIAAWFLHSQSIACVMREFFSLRTVYVLSFFLPPFHDDWRINLLTKCRTMTINGKADHRWMLMIAYGGSSLLPSEYQKNGRLVLLFRTIFIDPIDRELLGTYFRTMLNVYKL